MGCKWVLDAIRFILAEYEPVASHGDLFYVNSDNGILDFPMFGLFGFSIDSFDVPSRYGLSSALREVPPKQIN